MTDDIGMDEQVAPPPVSLPSQRVMALLTEHVPLTLLLDLGGFAPPSRDIVAGEGLPDEAWWEPRAQAAG